MPFKLLMPKLGESIEEATITKWFVKENDQITEDQPLCEIATDKVDSEIPSPVSGKVSKIYYQENDKIPVGTLIALIDTEINQTESINNDKTSEHKETVQIPSSNANKLNISDISKQSERFYSPLVRNIAKSENLSFEELETIQGTGSEGRVTKSDILKYIENKNISSGKKDVIIPEPNAGQIKQEPIEIKEPVISKAEKSKISVTSSPDDQIIEMDRVRKIIADHMVMSVQVSPHVTNIVEADVTNLVLWRNKIKEKFLESEKENLTFMPVFIEATVKALKDFPMVNSSVDGYKIIVRKNINIGVAVSLPTGNLIVPVIKDADNKSLTGLTKELNTVAKQARENKLSPDAIQGGTFTITNFGTFRNIIGTPIINQPQVAILATGMIEKKPAVIETPTGDVIAIRHKMYLSLSYDHRIVDGALGGAFLRKIADYLENFDLNREI